MAFVQRDPSGNFHLCFRFGGRRFKRSLHTKHQRKADAAASHVEENLRLVGEGRLELPDNVDVPTFLLSDGKLAEKPKVASNIKLGSLFDEYKARTPEGALEASSIQTFRTHMGHVVRILGAGTLLRSIRTSDLQRYVTTRSKEKGRRGTVSPVTIRKELATFASLWNWARTQELTAGEFPRKGIVFGKHEDKPPFQTWTQIERQIKRDGLNAYQAEPLWESLYLSTDEIAKLLEHIRENSGYPFLHPMCVLAAYTGARRSELCRARVADFDFAGATAVIRERKRSRYKRTTRVVPLTSIAREVLVAWVGKKEPGVFMFPEDHRVDRSRSSKLEPGAVSPNEASEHLNHVLARSKWEPIPGWHVFRHSFISNCASRGVDQRFIDSWVGHQTDEQRNRYRHLFPDSQQQAIDSVFA